MPSARSWAASRRRPDGPRRLLGRSREPSWADLGPLGPSQERAWCVPGASRTLLNAFPGVRAGPPNAPERPTEEFSRFFVVLGPIFVVSNELFERSRRLRLLCGSGPASPSSIFARCASIVEYRSAVPADTTPEDSLFALTSLRSCKLEPQTEMLADTLRRCFASDLPRC